MIITHFEYKKARNLLLITNSTLNFFACFFAVRNMRREGDPEYLFSGYLKTNLPLAIVWYVVITRQQVFQKEIYSNMFKQERMQKNL